jgi:hypothetical protein
MHRQTFTVAGRGLVDPPASVTLEARPKARLTLVTRRPVDENVA